MLQKPCLKAHYHLQAVEGDGAVLLSESGHSILQGRLYELVYNRALASQMASARLERTTVELTDGAGRAVPFS